MVHRGIMGVAAALTACFLFLSYLDSEYFLVHFYKSLIYIAIVLMLFFFEDRWAYMFGILAPAVWLFMIATIGGMPRFLRQVQRVFELQSPDFGTNLLGAAVVFLSVLMIAISGNRWRHEFSGLKKGWSTFLVCFGILVAYYGILAVWILRWTAAFA